MFSKLFDKLTPGKSKPAPRAGSGQTKRHNDAILVLGQDNKTATLPIQGSNYLALQLLGVKSSEIVDKDFRKFLPDSVNEIINDNIEFIEFGKGIDEVLNRLAHFRVKASDGAEIPLKIRVIRTLSSANTPLFQVVMNDSSLAESLAANRENYRSGLAKSDITDEKTGLLARVSVIKDLELITTYGARNSRESCYAIFKFINFDDLMLANGIEGAWRKVKSLIEVILSTKRDSDIVGVLADGTIILILPETPKENLKIPVSRIHGKLSQDIKSELRIYYNALKAETTIEDQLSTSIKGMAGTF